MNDTAQLIRELKLNYSVIQMQLEGLTHADTLLQLPFRGNCLNWVLGHIVDSRAVMVQLAGIEPLWDDADYVPYRRESEPIVDGDGALELYRIMADLTVSQERLLSRLPQLTEEKLFAGAEEGERTVYERLSFSSWHETYHTGQLEVLRQLAGKDDKVI